MGFLKAFYAFFLAVPTLISITREIWKWVKENYERKARAEAVKELHSAIKESRETLDNSKLMDLLQGKTKEEKK